MSNWQKEMTARIGSEVQRLRGDRSQLWLEQRTEKLGHRVSRGGLSQLESGNRRSISVAEWLVLSAALEVPPLLLIWPKYPDGRVDMLPKFRVDAFDAHAWVAGRFSMEWCEFEDSPGEVEPVLSNRPVPLVALVDEVHEALPSFVSIANQLRGDAEQIAAAKASLAAYEKKKRELNRKIEALGGYIDELEDKDE